jgi:transcriptional regulator with XRE-family HTH domain
MQKIKLSYRRPSVPFDQLTLGQRVEWLLLRRKLSQTAAALRCGTSQATIANIISGNRKPSAETLMKLARGLDSSPSFIMYGYGLHLTAAEPDGDRQEELLNIYKNLNSTDQQLLLMFARAMKPFSPTALSDKELQKTNIN